MAKPNYQYEKRQKELAKKNKKEEKRRQKLAENSAADHSSQTVPAAAPEAGPRGADNAPAAVPGTGS